MDFLDPKRKKSHNRRLLIGYLLVAVALALATWILLLNGKFGYWIDPKTRTIIQNGTVFVDSNPGGANIALNTVAQSNRTASRLVLPGGQQYTIKLTLDGYRDWTRVFALEGGKIERLTYPILIPKQLVTTEPQLYSAEPGVTSQSLDKRWLLVQQPGQTYVFDLYDLNNPSSAPVPLTIPSNILTDGTKASSINVVEWASDNRHVLMERTADGIHEFLMIDTSTIASSININTVLTINPTRINLRDRKYDQLYVYDGTGGLLRLGDTKNRTVSGAILNNVIDYTTYGSDIVMYATTSTKEPNEVDIRIRENDKSSYLLKTIAPAEQYLLKVSEFESTPYYVVGSEKDKAALVYRDPLLALKGQSQTPLTVASVLRLDNINFVSFSPNFRFIAAQSKNKFIVYDIEGDRQYKLDLPHDIAASTKLLWVDGFHLGLTAKDSSYIVDFDGSNEQALAPSTLTGGPYFSADFKNLFTVAPSKSVSGRYSLTQTSLIKK